MAEMNLPNGKTHSKSGLRAKRLSTKVDLTAMVDLGFLLITFFMLATTFTKPKAMEVNMPDNSDRKGMNPIKTSKSLSILLGEGDKIYTYVDAENPQVDSTDFSPAGIRALLFKRQAEVAAKWGDKNELVVLIKSMPKARYKNLVDILDEMSITQTKRYAIVKTDENDKAIMKLVGASEL
jgi:biopolymer transport protein ExbD